MTAFVHACVRECVRACVTVCVSVCVCSEQAGVSNPWGPAPHLEGVLLADVVVHRQHGDVEAGQQDATQDALLLIICTTEEERGRRLVWRT